MALIIRKVVPPAPTDVLAPATPAGIDTSATTTTVSATCSPTGDMFDGVNVATGMANYTWNVDGVDQAPISAPATEIQGPVVLYQIGTSGATLQQSGRQYTTTGGGTGIDGTSDSMCFAARAQTYTGDFDAYLFVASWSGPGNDYATAGLMWREATPATVAATPGARYGSIGYWLNAQSKGVDTKSREVVNTVFANGSHFFYTGNGSTGWLHIRRRGDVFTYRYSATGGTFTIANTQTLAGVGPVMIGQSSNDNTSPAATLTAVFQNFRVTQSADLSIGPITTAVAKTLKIKATDNAGNISAYSATVVVAPTNPPVQSVKWRPGYGVNATIAVSSADSYADATSRFDRMRTLDNFTFGHIIPTWRNLEPTQGNYNWDQLDALIAYLNNTTVPGRFSTPKNFTLEPWMQKFGVDPNNPMGVGTQALPQYIIDQGWWYIRDGQSTADLAVAACQARWLALFQAIGARYNTHPNLECIILTETASQRTVGPYKTLVPQIKSFFPNTNFCVGHNWFGDPKDAAAPGNTGDRDLAQIMLASKVGGGGPDILPPASGGGPYESNGMLARRNAGDNIVVSGWGTFNFNTGTNQGGVTPLHLQRQERFNQQSSQGHNFQLFAYTQAEKATHVSFYLDGLDDFADVITNANANPIFSTYPTAYT